MFLRIEREWPWARNGPGDGSPAPRFYARYNELNKVDDFDVECRWDAPTGSHVERRGCLAGLAARVDQTYASDYVSFLQGSGPMPDNDPHMALLDRYSDFKDNVLYLLKMNPDLRRLVQERAAAVKRFNDERCKYFKGRLVVCKWRFRARAA